MFEVAGECDDPCKASAACSVDIIPESGKEIKDFCRFTFASSGKISEL